MVETLSLRGLRDYMDWGRRAGGKEATAIYLPAKQAVTTLGLVQVWGLRAVPWAGWEGLRPKASAPPVPPPHPHPGVKRGRNWVSGHVRRAVLPEVS